MEQNEFLRLTPAGGHYFFGYYDVAAYSPDGARHLTHRVPFQDRCPGASDVAEIGYGEGRDGERFFRLAETTAWNFQQGAMLQFRPGSDGREILFNRRDGGGFHGVVMPLDGGSPRRLAGPIAAVDPLGRFALGLNFSRLFDFRKGYGYAGEPDPFAAQTQPGGDGVVRFDLDGGGAEVVLSLAELGRRFPPPGGRNRKLVVNHITCNPDGSRFVGLLRTFPEQSGEPLQTLVFTAASDGTDVRVLRDYGVASHYHWKNATELMMVVRLPDGALTLVELQDGKTGCRVVDPEFFAEDGHCSYSPDGRWILYDSYPQDGRRALLLYDLRVGRGHHLAWLKSAPLDSELAVDIRCDLHPRWRPDGRAVSFDSIHEGFRGIYEWDLTAWLRQTGEAVI